MKRTTRRWTANVREGNWYAIPLRDGGYGIGLVARKGKGGILFGYFFGPRSEQPPTLEDTKDLTPEIAVYRSMFGDLGIQEGKWPLLGKRDEWNREQWPMPEFGRIAEATGHAWIDTYSDDDPSQFVRERRCSIEEARRLPTSSLDGYGAVEIMLTKMLTAAEPGNETKG
jgi:hypothetical protein